MLGGRMTDSPTLNLVFGIARTVPKLTLEQHEEILAAGTPASFWSMALEWAKQASAATNVSISVILAQWAIETGYGGADWQPPRNNPGNVGNFTAGGQNNFPTLAAGVQGYIQCMLQGYYNAVRTGPANWYNECLALGQSPWAGAHYALPGSFPGSELIWVINNYNLTQYDAGGPTPAPSPTPAPPVVFRKPL
jgi:flagellum-specific peptidoglycan hydrolase FlgJ